MLWTNSTMGICSTHSDGFDPQNIDKFQVLGLLFWFLHQFEGDR